MPELHHSDDDQRLKPDSVGRVDRPEGLDEWQARVLPQIHAISEEYRDRYSGENLTHFTQLAYGLFQSFGQDLALAQAGFLHHLRASEVEKHLIGEVARGVTEIIEGQQKFRTLDFLGPKATERAVHNLLPKLRDRRAPLLLVRDQIHHVDPLGLVASWSGAFHTNPGLPMENLPARPAFADRFGDAAAQVAFIRMVVAPVAESIGLWAERNVLHDSALLMSDRERASALQEFAARSTRRMEGIADSVRNAVHDTPVVRVEWEWRHLGSLHSLLPAGNKAEANWDARMHRLGFVTIVCPDDAACYLALSRLHSRFTHRPDGLRDLMGNPKPSGYRGIHTFLVFDGKVGVVATEGVMVRLIPETVDERRYAPSEHWYVPDSARKGASIQVFTPHGDAVLLQPGSTVLNFAIAVHQRFVVLAKGARVNQENVDLLYKLADGDVVNLHLSDVPRPLPSNWQQMVPKTSQGRVRALFRKWYRASLVAQGRRHLVGILIRAGIGRLPDPAELDGILERAQAVLRFPPPGEERPATWWLEQLGILAHGLSSAELPYRVLINSETAQHLVSETSRRVMVRQLRKEFGLEEVSEDRFHVERCPACMPTADEDFVVEKSRSKVTLHRSGAPCAARAHPVESLRRYVPQYLWVEGTDRSGLVVDVGEVFARRGIGLEELVAKQTSLGVGAVRVRIAPVEDEKLQVIMNELLQLEGVQIVRGPKEGETDAEADNFPPRTKHVPARAYTSSPYRFGQEVQQDEDFYGMTGEVEKLNLLFNEVLSNRSVRGRQAFVTGPLKVGKTSAALAFQRDISRRRPGRVLSVYVRARRGEAWPDYERRLAEELIRRTGEINLPLPLDRKRLSGRRSVHAVLREVRGQTRVPTMLILDEIILLILSSVAKRKSSQLMDGLSRLAEEPGVMMVWIGPTAGLRSIPIEYVQLLRSAEEVRVKPFTEEIVGEYLSVPKQGSRYKIDVEAGISTAVHRFTGGNPFWTAAVATKMWDEASSADARFARYDNNILMVAEQHVPLTAALFKDRYRDELWSEEKTNAVWAVLSVLSRAAIEGFDSAYLSLDQLCRWDDWDVVVPRELPTVELMEELEEQGAITAMVDRSTAVRKWRIVAPILALHILSRGE